MDKETLDKIDPTFRQDLKDSEKWVAWSRHYFESLGRATIEYPKDKLEDGSTTDRHDLGYVIPVEVKHRPCLNFKGVADLSRWKDGKPVGEFPLLIVDRAHHVLRNLRKYRSLPEEYWIWNRTGTGVLRVNVLATMDSWVRREHYVPKYQRNMDFYLVPVFRQLAGSPMHFRHEVRSYVERYGDLPHTGAGLHYQTTEALAGEIHSQELWLQSTLDMLRTTKWATDTELRDIKPDDTGNGTEDRRAL